MIAWSEGSVRTQDIAVTFLAILLKCVAVKSGLANLTVRPVGIVETLETTSGVRVTVTGLAQICVVIAFAWLALSTGYFGIAEIILGALVATRTSVSLVTLTNYVLRYRIEGTTVGVRVTRIQCTCVRKEKINK